MKKQTATYENGGIVCNRCGFTLIDKESGNLIQTQNTMGEHLKEHDKEDAQSIWSSGATLFNTKKYPDYSPPRKKKEVHAKAALVALAMILIFLSVGLTLGFTYRIYKTRSMKEIIPSPPLTQIHTPKVETFETLERATSVFADCTTSPYYVVPLIKSKEDTTLTRVDIEDMVLLKKGLTKTEI